MRKIYLTLGVAVITALAAAAGTNVEQQAKSVTVPLTTSFPWQMTSLSDSQKSTLTNNMSVVEERDLHGAKIQSLAGVRPMLDDEAESMCYVSFNVTKPDDNREYGTPRITIYGSAGYAMASADAEWVWGDLLRADEPVGVGDYGILLTVDVDDPVNSVGTIAIYKEISINDTDVNVDIDLSEATHLVKVDAVMADGNPYPTTENEEESGPLAVMRIEFGVWGPLTGGVMTFGLGHWYYLTNDMPEGTYYRQQMKYFDTETGEGSILFRELEGPIVSDIIETVTASDYTPVSARFSLTQAEKEQVNAGLGFVISYLSSDSYSSFGMQSYAPWMHPVENLSVNVAYPPFHNSAKRIQEVAVQLNSVLADVDGMDNIKYGGFSVKTDDGVMVVPSYYTLIKDGENSSLSFFAENDVFNINAEKNDIWNFSKTNVLMCIAMPMFDTSDPTMPVMGIMGQGSLVGAYNEHQELPDLNKYLTAMKYNGEEITAAELVGKPAMGSTFELTYKFDEQLVNGVLPATTELVYGCGIVDFSDIMAPTATSYTILNSEGLVANTAKPEDCFTLHIGLLDFNSMGEGQNNMTVAIEAAPMEGGDWVSFPVETKLNLGNNTTMLASAKLDSSLVEAEKWYKVRVTVNDDAGNYCIQTLDNCFIYTDASSIDTNVIPASKVVSSTYYDLSGRRVANPGTGLYVKVSRMSDGSVLTSKVAVR